MAFSSLSIAMLAPRAHCVLGTRSCSNVLIAEGTLDRNKSNTSWALLVYAKNIRDEHGERDDQLPHPDHKLPPGGVRPETACEILDALLHPLARD